MTKRISITVLVALLTVLTTIKPASAGMITASAGLSYASESNLNNPKGFNIKYGYEWDDVPVGIITSFTYLSSDSEEYYARINGNATKDVTYRSFAMGPTWRINDFLGVYGLFGFGKTDNQYRVKKSASEREVISFDKTSALYGAGFFLNLTDEIVFSAGFEATRYDDADRNTHTMDLYNVNIGYRW